MNETRYHVPVLLQEIMNYLNIQPGKQYIDTTFGDGGHTQAILEHGGRVLGVDRDQSAFDRASTRLERYVDSKQLRLIHGNFSDLESIARSQEMAEVDGILLDLGMSSFQIEESGRGFSFQKNEPLDMRMDTSADPSKAAPASPAGGFDAVTAADLLAGLGENELVTLLTRYGQVPRARTLAKAIVARRKQKPFETTQELVDIVLSVNPVRGRLHPATKVFMALRMAVNDELNSLSRGLGAAISLLHDGGRVAVISFHQGEDRIVKQLFKTDTRLEVLTKKPVTATAEETHQNPRARSAKLRVAERK